MQDIENIYRSREVSGIYVVFQQGSWCPWELCSIGLDNNDVSGSGGDIGRVDYCQNWKRKNGRKSDKKKKT